jgi:hypothetical protein
MTTPRDLIRQRSTSRHRGVAPELTLLLLASMLPERLFGATRTSSVATPWFGLVLRACGVASDVPVAAAVAGATVLAATAVVLLRGWIGWAGWGDDHRLALPCGAPSFSTTGGYVVMMTSAPPTVDRFGQIAADSVFAPFLLRLGRRRNRPETPVESRVRFAHQTLRPWPGPIADRIRTIASEER